MNTLKNKELLSRCRLWIRYLIPVVVFIILKFNFKKANSNELYFLLLPTSEFIELLTNHNAHYIDQAGFYYSVPSILIDESCAGVNFWLLSFLMLSFLLITKTKRKFRTPTIIVVSLVIAYCGTVITNTSRILISIFTKDISNNAILQTSWWHQAQGSFVYLFGLILLYQLCSYSLNKIENYA